MWSWLLHHALQGNSKEPVEKGGPDTSWMRHKTTYASHFQKLEGSVKGRGTLYPICAGFFP